MLNPEIRRKLSKLNRERDKREGSEETQPVAPAKILMLDDVIHGRVHTRECGQLLIYERGVAAVDPDNCERIVSAIRNAPCLEYQPEEMLFLDIETCGLANCPVFLIGTLVIREEQVMVEQFFARDYSEEAALLEHVADVMSGYKTLVTFNGRTFDIPYIRDRMILHRLPFRSRHEHTDLLLEARRKWRGKLPDCRLQTLEQHICGRHRFGDTPGALIPEIYHTFVKTGNAAPLEGVFYHNALDLITMVDLLPRLITAPTDRSL